MSNLKTWPEVIYLHPRELEGDSLFHPNFLPHYENDDIYATWDIKDIPWGEIEPIANIKYIRADIAKQQVIEEYNRVLLAAGYITIEEARDREQKLINEAYNFVVANDGALNIYIDTGLEEI